MQEELMKILSRRLRKLLSGLPVDDGGLHCDYAAESGGVKNLRYPL